MEEQLNFGRRRTPASPGGSVAKGVSISTPLATRPMPIDTADGQDPLEQLKIRVFALILENIDVATFDRIGQERARQEIGDIVTEIIGEKQIAVSAADQTRLTQDILNDMFGLGPLEPLMTDPDITDILVNGAKNVFIERKGRIEETDIQFRDNAQLVNLCVRIAGSVNRRVDESSPICDARLADGSRVNIIIPPLSVDAPLLTIRRFRKDRLRLENLVEYAALSAPMARYLGLCVRGRCNIVISGGTGSGKTTLLNALSFFIRENDRVVTIEDTAELQLQQRHVCRLETRPANIEGKGEVTQRDLVKNTLRMRPDRIIVGEVRGAEAFDMLQAMNTGHSGSMSTIHANSPRDCLHRLSDMVAISGFDLPDATVQSHIHSALDLLIQIERLYDGSRRITKVQEVTGLRDNLIELQEMFSFEITGESADGEIEGDWLWSGAPTTLEKNIRRQGLGAELEALFAELQRQRSCDATASGSSPPREESPAHPST